MKLIDYLALLVFIQIPLFAQTSLEDELIKVKSNPDLKVESVSKDRISVNYSNLKTTIFNLGENTNLKNNVDSVPLFVFNLWGLDTSLFNYKYYFWEEVPLGTDPIMKPLIGDINNNSLVELYGFKKDFFTGYSEIWCYEQKQNGIFQPTYKYPENTIIPYNIYDIDIDGNSELHLIATHFDSLWGGYVNDQTFFEKPSFDSLATQFYFDYNIFTGDGFNNQLNDFTFGDFNNDDTTEAIYHSLLRAIHLVKFNKAELTFDSVFTYSTFIDSSLGHEFVAGFIVGDFDLDGKTDIIFSSEYGNIYVIENEGEDNYLINWEGNSGIWNSYIYIKTNDIDGNDKPEFWIGGESFAQGVTRLVCYETDGDNTYHPVAEIEFPGLLTLNSLSGLGIDIDNDKNEELFINVGNVVVIIKFTGSSNNPNYDVYYLRQFENICETATMFRFFSELYPAIILSMGESNINGRRDFTRFFKHYLTADVKEERDLLYDYKLFSNYPNPFNPSTTIRFIIPERSELKIKVYNSIGEEIITLLDQSLERGEHTIVWNGRDNNNLSVPSGVYFISMISGRFHKIIKSVLLK